MSNITTDPAEAVVLTVRNRSGQVFTVGKLVRHYDGWEGVIQAISINPRSATLIFVKPFDLSKVSPRDCWKLNSKSAEKTGKTHFVRSLDHGQTMGNFTPIA